MSVIGAAAVGWQAARTAHRAQAVTRSGARSAPSPVLGFFRRLGAAFFTLCALGAFCYAAFSAAEWAGFVTLGVSLLVAEWRLSPSDEENRSG